MRPVLAVLITYCDERELLTACLQSLLRQRPLPDEIVVYDDASEAPATDFVPRGAPVSVVRGPVNRGPSFGRNCLARATSAEYIHFHDADDVFAPTWCAKIRDAIARTEPDWVLTEVASFQDDQVVCERVLDVARLVRGEDLVSFCLRGTVLVPSGTYRRHRVQAIGGYRSEQSQAEDFDFHVRLAAAGVSYTVLTEPLVRIRLRPEGRSRRDPVGTWCDYLDTVVRVSGELPVQYRPDLADAARRAGSVLLELGAVGDAQRGFDLAERLGRGRLSDKRWLYRVLASVVGVNRTERFGRWYRHHVPLPLRRGLTWGRWS